MDHVTIASPDPGSVSPLPTGFAALDRETQRRAFHSLATAAIVYAAVYASAFATGWAIHMIDFGGFHSPGAISLAVTGLSIGVSLVVHKLCRREKLPPEQFTRIAEVYLVVSSLGIAANYWGWESFGRAEVVHGVSWVGLWIVMFPNVVTLTPGRILRASALAALTLPAVTLGSVLVHGVPQDFGSPWIAVASLSVPALICVGIAWSGATRIFRLASDVSEAKRMGSYRLTRKLGEGGMGEVWEAEHRMLVRPAAIKLIKPEHLSLDGRTDAARTALLRFEREAQATALLTSPHTIALYDFGRTDDGAFYYVMELLRGLDLKRLVDRTGPIPPERAIRFLSQACESLADAHGAGMVHRDIKPGNLFSARQGRELDFVKVLDFGLVKDSVPNPSDAEQLTMEGIASGTPGFMAPEMVHGEADPRSDLYALGCVGYWLLTGQLVFDGPSPMAILVRHLKDEPPPLSSRSELDVPDSLESALRACLAKDPAERPQSADELAGLLQEAARDLPPWTAERAEHWWRTHVPELVAPALAPSARSRPGTVVPS